MISPTSIRLTPTVRLEIDSPNDNSIKMTMVTEAHTLDHERVFNSAGTILVESQVRMTITAIDKLKDELYKRLRTGPDRPEVHKCPECGARAFNGKTVEMEPCQACAGAEALWKARNYV